MLEDMGRSEGCVELEESHFCFWVPHNLDVHFGQRCRWVRNSGVDLNESPVVVDKSLKRSVFFPCLGAALFLQG